jgi:hypothetical protein
VTRLAWPAVLERAANIVASYDTGVTLRQLFYRLVADGTIPNTAQAYKGLSRASAEARRAGTFPALVDRRRSIDRPAWWTSPEEAREALREQYRRDRTEGQPFNIYVGCEKDALSALLAGWLDERGIPVLIVGGWSSEGYERAINADLSTFGFGSNRPSVLLYIGDLDPAGEGIEGNIAYRLDVDRVDRVALDSDQAVDLGLPENTDPAVAAKLTRHPGRKDFLAKYGRLFQIEVDAIPPETLRTMLDAAIESMWDRSAFEAVLAQEADERDEL